MLHIRHRAADLVTLEAVGTITRQDYDRVLPELDRILAEEPALRVLIELHDFQGWEPGARLAELKFDLRHYRDFRKIAIVGDDRVETWIPKLTAPFFSGETRYFRQSNIALALRWIAG